jgi:hypothetical protein
VGSRRCHHVDGAIVCGGAPSAADREAIARMKRRLAGQLTMTEAREDAGLSLGQAARVTEIPRERLEVLEAGAAPTESERAVLCEAYDVPSFAQDGGAHAG